MRVDVRGGLCSVLLFGLKEGREKKPLPESGGVEFFIARSAITGRRNESHSHPCIPVSQRVDGKMVCRIYLVHPDLSTPRLSRNDRRPFPTLRRNVRFGADFGKGTWKLV